MGEKICIHGHFYQPPRENPWTGVVGRERSAAPWHDWNDRITDECYLPNTAARILDGQGCIRTTLNNYSRISCDFGPTLLTWLERKRPGVYENIIRADRDARERFSGHGCAIAHPYHHLILPLLSRADKETEVRWGIRDFEDRFGRFPEGMWLPEMAVDPETLAVLAENGISFTLLSPHPGFRTRQHSQESWNTVSIDTTVPYVCRLPGGAEITVFFQDAALSSQVAFGDLLKNGDRFADHLFSASPGGGLVHAATDGETFGHHHRFGEMALGWCLDRIESSHPGTLTVYGEYLASHPPVREVEIAGCTSWSCPHGIARWDDGCSCESGRHPGWKHDWRGPLRTAIRDLSVLLWEIFSREAGAFFRDPGLARDASIGLLRDSSQKSIRTFFQDHAVRPMDKEEQQKALALLEMAWQALAMQTSCAWFFDDIADREAVQVLRFAARAIQIARDQTGALLEQAFSDRLSAIPGNRPRYPDGGVVFRECVLPLVLSPLQQAACLALVDSAGEGTCVLHADALAGEFLSHGELFPAHDLSLLATPVQYCFMSTGRDTGLVGISSPAGGLPAKVSRKLLATLKKKGYPAVAETFPTLFPAVVTLAELPPAGRRLVVRSSLDRLNRAYIESAGALLDRCTGLEEGAPVPRSTDLRLTRMARYVLSCRMEMMLNSPESAPADLRSLASAFADWGITETLPGLLPPAGHVITRLMEDWAAHPEDRGRLEMVIDVLHLIRNIGAAYPARELQDLFMAVRDGDAITRAAGLQRGDGDAVAWREKFRTLAQMLGVSVQGGAGHLRQ